jgi:serine/threonine protein kinase
MYVQLWDYALSRDLFPADYYLSSTAAITSSDVGTPLPTPALDARPVKWMAPEALRSNICSSASDVWAFGVTMWELFTCGQQPYSEIDAEDIQLALAGGTRLQQPYNCPDEM